MGGGGETAAAKPEAVGGGGPFGRGRRQQQHFGPPGLVGTGEKAKNFKHSFKRLLGRLRPERAVIVVVVVLSVISVACTIGAPKIMARASNLIFSGAISRNLPAGVTKEQVIQGLRASGQNRLADMLTSLDLHPGQGVDFATVGKVIAIVTALYLLGALFGWLGGYLMAGVVQRTVYRLRREVDQKIPRLPLKFFDGHARGDILSRLTNDIDNIQQTMQQVLTQIITSLLTLVGVLALMFWVSPLLAVISLCTIPLSVAIATVIAKRSQKQFALQWERTGNLNGHVEEMFTGHNIVKIFGRQQVAMDVFDKQNEKLYQASFRAQFMSGIIMPLMMFVSNLNYVAVCVLGALRVASGTMSIGDVLAFVQYVQMFGQPITQTASVMNVLQSAVASSERVFEMLDEEEEKSDVANPTVLKEVGGHIVMRDVSFRYLADKPLIEHLNLEVQPGQTVAIVGPTGAGKTTLVNLLMRFYEIDEGGIEIDGVDTRAMTRNGVRRLFGMVLQDAWLFSGTIRENIAYGKENATWEEIQIAAEAAHVDHFVRTLPEGYDTKVEDDSTNISQGERQLLTIARAFLADPQILILDEATSSVDTRTEVLIQRAMAKLLKGRTSFVIAHRLSTIRDADVILVMNEGQIIEQGTHQELLCQGGFYFDLYNSQFAEALEEAC
ncbi:MAG: multidrug ABC transporter ATP-binding protein [Actinobacteria bacterium RBG_16_64_13]|nr:MAG: multidrug ABC transporter ATP-binding protein [Actinobacteria bacterium RBG_16_64_13]